MLSGGDLTILVSGTAGSTSWLADIAEYPVRIPNLLARHMRDTSCSLWCHDEGHDEDLVVKASGLGSCVVRSWAMMSPVPVRMHGRQFVPFRYEGETSSIINGDGMPRSKMGSFS